MALFDMALFEHMAQCVQIDSVLLPIFCRVLGIYTIFYGFQDNDLAVRHNEKPKIFSNRLKDNQSEKEILNLPVHSLDSRPTDFVATHGNSSSCIGEETVKFLVRTFRVAVLKYSHKYSTYELANYDNRCCSKFVHYCIRDHLFEEFVNLKVFSELKKKCKKKLPRFFAIS